MTYLGSRWGYRNNSLNTSPSTPVTASANALTARSLSIICVFDLIHVHIQRWYFACLCGFMRSFLSDDPLERWVFKWYSIKMLNCLHNIVMRWLSGFCIWLESTTRVCVQRFQVFKRTKYQVCRESQQRGDLRLQDILRHGGIVPVVLLNYSDFVTSIWLYCLSAFPCSHMELLLARLAFSIRLFYWSH